MNIADSSILITGGTGSFGRAFLKYLLQNYPNIKRIVIYSRDELKQWQIQQEYPPSSYPQLRFFIGDIRDKERLKRALEQIDIVVHAAALKQVPAAEYNPFEFIKTNVLGAENLIQASLDSSVKHLVALSTDKAAAPINLYGATKLCSDKLFVAANNIKGHRDVKYSVVRYGNVMGSRGSVIPYFLEKAQSGILPITDMNMTRFSLPLQESIKMVLWAIHNSAGGEIFVPKIPSYRIGDLANAIGPSCRQEIVGIRPGEKIHEEMITTADSPTTYDLGQYFAILSNTCELFESDVYSQDKKVQHGFSYDSGSNPSFLTIDEIRNLIRLHIDPNFVPF